MTKTIWNPGSRITSAWLNAMQYLAFDDQDFDGHYARLTDDALTAAPGNIKYEWQAFRDGLKVSNAGSTTVSYKGGTLTLSSGSVIVIPPGSINLPNNATSYVYVNSSGAVVSSTTRPVISYPLAEVVTATGSILAISDARERMAEPILPRTEAIKVFGGLGEEGDYTLSSGTATLSRGEYYFKNFTIGSAAILTISQFARIYCSGNVQIDGSIVISPASSGGPFLTPFGGLFAGLPGSGQGRGIYNNPGPTYSYAASPVGSGGASGAINSGNGNINTPAGGDGGGGIIFEVAGTIFINGTIQANGTDGGTPTGATGTAYGGGAGGGSGGLILLKSLISITATNAATFAVKGGKGGNGIAQSGSTTIFGSGGGGGGGGIISLQAPIINNAATHQITGGAAGSNGPGTGSASIGGGGGGSYGGSGGIAAGAPTAGSIGIYIPLQIRPVI